MYIAEQSSCILVVHVESILYEHMRFFYIRLLKRICMKQLRPDSLYAVVNFGKCELSRVINWFSYFG